jgi:hypothetical protein
VERLLALGWVGGRRRGGTAASGFSAVAWTAGGGASWMASTGFSAMPASYPSLLNATIQNLRVRSSC